MSPLLPDRVRLYLGQQGWRLEGPQPALAQSWHISAQTGQLDALLDHITLPEGGRKLTVVLEHVWARCQLVKFPSAVRSTAERQAFLQAIFRDVHGIDTQAWRIVVESGIAGEPVFASAIEQSTLAALQAFATRHHLRLTSVQPAFCAAWNQYHARMNAPHGALAWLADQRASVGLWQEGRWLMLRSQALAQGNGAGLGSLLKLLIAGSGYAHEGGVYYLAGQTAGLRLPLPENWTCVSLEQSAQVEAP
ncbi:hypothetical protein [Uliginosibacterium gangwonense]|uniref:hypothetical protein n=1 Tax=Uliginosibacterium gangwonense TaxID=392736 RepID=UPI00036788E8|nr:hypothetical protein [Uliginosibacterium gangwonense]